MTTPNLSPLQALQLCRLCDPVVVSGWRYHLDGPMGCPAELMVPHATAPGAPDEDDGTEFGCFCPAGEHGEPIDETTEWYEY